MFRLTRYDNDSEHSFVRFEEYILGDEYWMNCGRLILTNIGWEILKNIMSLDIGCEVVEIIEKEGGARSCPTTNP